MQEGFRIRSRIWIEQESNSGDCGGDLFQQFRPLPTQCRLVGHEPGDVAAWARQVSDKTAANWIGHVDKDDRDSAALAAKEVVEQQPDVIVVETTPGVAALSRAAP